jgi:hypothetical protein
MSPSYLIGKTETSGTAGILLNILASRPRALAAYDDL